MVRPTHGAWATSAQVLHSSGEEECPRMNATTAPVMVTHLPLPGRRQGKVRDIYDVPPDGSTPPRVLIVASDRISAFDVVMPTPVPGKGRELTSISTRWFEKLRRWDLIVDHLPVDRATGRAGHRPIALSPT